MGGVRNRLQMFANNHRARCNRSPSDAMELCNPREDQPADVHFKEKIGTEQD